MNPAIPSRYKQTAPCQRGGIGAAAKLHDQYLERDVILKFVSEIDSLPRLEAEITSLQKVNSNHVVQIYDIIFCVKDRPEDQDIVYGIIEEYLSGDDLTSVISKTADQKQKLQILYQISCGILDLHNSFIIHRDLKPDNIKFNGDGLLKIFDFNLAKTGLPPLTTISFAGTPGFMAPELYNAPPTIDFPIDIYAFGIIAFLLFSGRMPSFAGTSHTPPRDPAANERLDSSLPVHLAEVLNNCVQTRPESRPTALTIRNALRKELSRDTHRGKLTYKTHVVEINKDKPQIRIHRNNIDSIVLFYDGLNFIIQNIAGDVKINNSIAQQGQFLDGSYVIILGADALKSSRLFITFDISSEVFVL